MSDKAQKRGKKKAKKSLTPEERAVRERVYKIADILGESGPPALGQLHRIVRRRDLDWIKARLRQTWEVHKAGGMLTDDGSRKRTIGGIFFHLCKRHWLDDVEDIEAELIELDTA